MKNGYMRRINRKKRGCKIFKKGFTLIELLVVVLIIGILAGVALPQYQVAVLKARFTEIQTVSSSLSKMIELYYLANGSYPKYWSELDIDIPNCSEEQYALGDLICQKIRIDLSEGHFIAWDSTTRENRPDGGSSASDFNVSYRYYFLHSSSNTAHAGEFYCAGFSDIGKKLCKGLCGENMCYMK